MRKRMNLNIVIFVNNFILYLFFMQFVLQASCRSLDCTFDEDLCDWNQEYSDHFDWTRTNEDTKTSWTGPRDDHTRGDWKGYYIYTEASYPRQNGDKARLISPMQEPAPHCLVFWYNMYGKGIGTLNIYTVPNNKVIFTKSGDIGDRDWRSEAISYNAPAKYQIVLEGIIGQDFEGDIAVDDISMTSGLCIIDCKNPAPVHGNANSTNFQYDSRVEISCNSGYRLKGKQTIVCQKGGTWSSSPTCEPVECENPTPKNGKANSAHFYYSSVIEITCTVGYNISGRSVISCQADGTWTGSPTCNLIDEETSSALIAAYILVPVVLVVIVLTFFVIFWRQKVVRYLTTLCANKRHDKNEQPRSGSLFTNVTYSGHHNDRQPNTDGEILEDSEYAIVTDDRNEKEQAGHSIYYNTVDAVDTKQEKIEHNYDHTKSSAKPVFDSTYSHVSGVTGNFESNYNTTPGLHPGKIFFQTDEQTMNNSYDVLNIQNSKQGIRKTQQPNMQDDQESEYDHAKAGGTDQVDYSHLQR